MSEKYIKFFHSSKHPNWRTPQKLYNLLDNEFHFDCDPCPTIDENLMHEKDMLGSSWGKSNYVNPPYKDVAKWLKKGYEEFFKEKIIVFLIPSRTDTRWFHDYVMKATQIRFIIGRIKFKNEGDRFLAPFPSIVVIYNNKMNGCEKFVSFEINFKE